MPENSTKTLSKTTLRIVQLFLRVYLLFLAPLTFFQRSLIYQPTRCERMPASRFRSLQSVVDVIVRADDGIDLHGWLTLAGPHSGSNVFDVKQSLAAGRPVVLYFPGNAGNRSRRTVQFDVMGSINVHMLLVDYRGYAENSGKPSEAHFARDARSIWNHLTGELGVPPNRIVIYGESLGGGVATRLASDLCREGIEPGGLILQSTFNSLVAVAQSHFPIVPVSLLLADRFPSERWIKNVTCPIVSIHGQDDSIVPFSLGQKLFNAAPATSSQAVPKRLISLPHMNHNDVYLEIMNRENGLYHGLEDFLDDVDQRSKIELAPKTDTNRLTPIPGEPPAAETKLDWTILGSGLLVVIAVLLWWMMRDKARN